ncbi:putative leucine-rich repeat domain superfamily [Helianthus annuus]|nr:putative leucine-rich repeat domain superfamily [Helianthus annuus]
MKFHSNCLCLYYRSCQLRRLEMVYGFFNNRSMTDALMKFPMLEELNFYLIKISKEEIETVGRYCPMLKTLKVNGGPCSSRVRDTDTDEWSSISYNEIAIAIGQNLLKLKHLELIENKMTNVGLRVILDNCHHLETLDLRQCLYIDLKGDLGKQCSQQIKYLKLPNDSLEGCPYIYNLSILDLFKWASDPKLFHGSKLP